MKTVTLHTGCEVPLNLWAGVTSELKHQTVDQLTRLFHSVQRNGHCSTELTALLQKFVPHDRRLDTTPLSPQKKGKRSKPYAPIDNPLKAKIHKENNQKDAIIAIVQAVLHRNLNGIIHVDLKKGKTRVLTPPPRLR